MKTGYFNLKHNILMKKTVEYHVNPKLMEFPGVSTKEENNII